MSKLTAVERDLIVWATAKVRWQEWVLASGEARTRLVSELSDRKQALLAAEAALLRRGMRLLRQARGEEPTADKGEIIAVDITRIELDDETGFPMFVHSEDCGGYCGYACNGTGFEDAKTVNADGTPSAHKRA